MQKNKVITVLVVGALAVAVTFGAFAYRSVLAATPTATSTGNTGTTGTTTQLGPGNPDGDGLHGGYNNQDLADALGITVDALNTATQTAYAAALKDAVSQGLITQAQADQLTSNGSAFPYGNHWVGWLTQNGIDFDTYLADALGISVDTLKAAYQTAYFTNIDQMVTAGTLTQAQADQILSNSSNMFVPGMRGTGGPGGPHGHGGGGDFIPNDNSVPSTTPSTTP